MGQKGLDFKHKEVVNITDGRRLRFRTGCNSRSRNWYDYIYHCALIESRYNRNKKDDNTTEDETIGDFTENNFISFIFERSKKKSNYVTKNNQRRTGYEVKEKYIYDVVCKVEL